MKVSFQLTRPLAVLSKVFSVMAAACSFAATVHAAPVLINGSFENPAGTGQSIVNSSNLPGWGYSGAGAQIVAGGLFGFSAQEGQQYLLFGAFGQNTSRLTQEVTGLNVGETYRLSYYLTLQQIPSGTVTESVRFGIGNASGVSSVTGAAPVWTLFNQDFTATSATASLVLLDLNDPNDSSFNLGLDNFSVTSLGPTNPPSGVPVPASAALLGLGLLGLVGRRAKSRV